MIRNSLLLIMLLMVSIVAKEVKIGYIDSKRIYQEFQETASAKTSLDKEMAKYKEAADSLKIRLDSAETEYESQKLMLSDVGKATKQSEIEQMRKEYAQYLESVWGKGGKIEQKNRELITPIVTKINEAVNKIAKEEGFSIVLDAAESKIVYAELGLDLTDLVVQELNKEYKPIEPATREKRILVFPFFEGNTEAQQEKLGELTRANLFALIRTQPKIEMISKGNVSSALQTRSITEGTRLEEKIIYEIGRELQADYVISGTVTRQGKRVEVEVVLSDPAKQITIITEKDEAPRAEELRETLSGIVAKLIKKI
ncbi:MAG: OmpH family outer membrane protein [bacterium]|nr:OmpH family outer membrane protein [candidate division WOR-3 bacterium]MDH5683500.1 OmpH family outer membrane protein [candidate division WOR-3 bacterium]